MKIHIRIGLLLLGLSFLLFSLDDSAADLILYKNGGKLRGIVEKKGDYYKVKFPNGSSLVHKDKVKKIIREKSEYEIYLNKKKKVDSSDADALYNLGKWAKLNGLEKFAEPNFEKAIQANPDHRQARHALGYLKYNGEWRTEKEVYLDKGYENFDGKWLPPSQAKRKRGLTKYKGEWLTDEEIMIRKGYVKYRNNWIAKSKRNRLVQKKTLDKIASLENDLEKARDARDKARNERDRYRKSLADAEDRIGDMKREVKSLQRTIEDLKEEIDDLEQDRHRYRDHYRDTKRDLRHWKRHHTKKHHKCSGP